MCICLCAHGYVYVKGHAIEERMGKEDKETKREKSARESQRMRQREREKGLVPYSYPSFARHYVERYTRIGDMHIHEHAIAHSCIHTHARAHTWTRNARAIARTRMYVGTVTYGRCIALMYVVMHY